MTSSSRSSGRGAEQDATLFGGAYRLLSQTAQSAETTVFRVSDDLGRKFDLIEFAPKGATPGIDGEAGAAEPASIDDFLRMAELLSRMRHPNIEPILQVFAEEDAGYALVDPKFGRPLAEEISAGDFFHQPPGVVAAAVTLVEAIAYMETLGVKDPPITVEAVSMDDDAAPMISIGRCLEGLLNALSAAQGGQRSVLGAASCVYAMMTGVLPPPISDRRRQVAAGDADPYHSVGMMDLLYAKRMLAAVDRGMAIPDPERPVPFADWATSFLAGVRTTAAGRTGGSMRGPKMARWLVPTLVLATGIGAAALYTLRPNLIPALDPPQPEVEIEVADIRLEPEAAGSETPAAPDQADTSSGDEVAALAPQPEPEAPPQPEPAAPPAAPATTGETTAADQTVDPAPEAETEIAGAPADAGQAAAERRPLSSEDVFAILRDMSSEPVEGATPEIAETPPAPQPAAPASTPGVETITADPTAPADTQVAAAPTNDTPEPVRQTTAETFKAVSEPGVEWAVKNPVKYRLVEGQDGGGHLEVLSAQDQFAFLAKNPWFSRTSQILSVGGVDVTPGFSLQNTLEGQFTDTGSATPFIPVTYRQTVSDPSQTAMLRLPVEAVARFGEITIVQTNARGGWTLQVAEVASALGGLRQGDIILGQPGGADLTTIAALRQAGIQGRSEGRATISLRVRSSAGQSRTADMGIEAFEQE
jgi:hypothetical protein